VLGGECASRKSSFKAWTDAVDARGQTCLSVIVAKMIWSALYVYSGLAPNMLSNIRSTHILALSIARRRTRPLSYQLHKCM
jgi:hypothetical protein